MSKSRMAGDKLKDSTPNEHETVGMSNYNNETYATDNQYGQDLSGITYKEGISKYFGDDGSIGENDIKNMMDAGYSSDDVYNFSKKRGLNYNQHGQKYMKEQGDYKIGKGSDQWGDIFGFKKEEGLDESPKPVEQNISTIIDNSIEQPPVKQPEVMGYPTPPKPGQTGQSQYQNVYQDNDITTSVAGNQNVVTNTQDNSIGQSGGNFTYADDYARGLKDRYILNLTNR